MVLALIEGIAWTKGLREALPFIDGLVSANPARSIEGILGEAREAGLSFGNDSARQLIRQLKANIESFQEFGVNGLNERPPLSSLGKAVSVLDRKYSFTVQIRGYNRVTEEQELRHVTVVSDKLLTINEIRARVLEMPDNNPGSQVLERPVTQVTGALRNTRG